MKEDTVNNPSDRRPCGHTREEEERSRETVDRLAKHFNKLTTGIRRKKTTPLPVQYSNSLLDRDAGQAKEYFHRVKNLVRAEVYQKQVHIYEKAIQELLSIPACCLNEGIECGFPRSAILPIEEIPGMIKLKELTTPRTGGGGRRKNPKIQDRNQFIADLKAQGLSSLEICKQLTAKNISLPQSWRKNRFNTWIQAHYSSELQNNVKVLISKAKI